MVIQIFYQTGAKVSVNIIKKKVSSYIARYPVLGTVQSSLHFTPWQTCSFQCLIYSEKHLAMPQLLRENFVQISTSVCGEVFIYTAE